MNHVLTILAAWAGAAALMFAVWLIQRRTRNAGIVDFAWTLGIGACVLAFASLADGQPVRRAVVAVLTGAWSLRLAWHLALRLSREPEDGRYQALREWAGPRAELALFVFFQMQAAWVVIFALPQYLVVQNTAPLGWTDAAALFVMLASLVGEAWADAQLAAFRRDERNRGQVCRAGWWRYSRHPNYFFEWLHWWAYPLLAVGLGWPGLLTLLGPAVMLLFLLKVTGIPPTEARALRSRGEAYREYQRTTSAFFPWLPKEAGS
jgi:steroid 5-alpha reductase family enzyme